MGAKLQYSRAVSVTRAELEKYNPPSETKTWKPVKHASLLNVVEKALSKEKISIRKRSLAVQRNGLFFFGVLDLTYKPDTGKEFTSALGIRASNNKSISIQIAVGARVFVCDNLAFHGDMIALKRKHTSKLDLQKEVFEAMTVFKKRYLDFCTQIKTMRAIKIKDDDAKLIILQGFMDQQILPIRYIEAVYRNYFSPKFKEFEERNLWSLHNAFTMAAKEVPEARKFVGLKRLGIMFNSIPGLSPEL